MRTRLRALSAVLAVLSCGKATNLPLKPSAISCPSSGTALTICDIKLETSTRHPARGADVSLDGVVVTTPTVALERSGSQVTLAGFFVQDRSSSDAFQGAYSGVLVTYDPALTPPVTLPSLFEIVHIDGKADVAGISEASDQQNLVRSKLITRTGQKAGIRPVVIARADLVSYGGEKRLAYEGVLIRLKEVSVSDTTVTANGMPMANAFKVNQSLIVSGIMYAYGAKLDEEFSSISGVLRLGTEGAELGQYLLTPRFTNDVVGKNASSIVTSIVDARDPNSPGHPLEGCQNLTGSALIGKCATAKFTGVVVTAAGGYVSKNLRALWIQDDSIPDGQFSGVKVTYNPAMASYIPVPGARIDVDGQLIEYQRELQVQYATWRPSKMGDPNIVAPIDISPDDIRRSSPPETNPYNGVVVRLTQPVVTTACVEDNKGRDHGDFIVDDEVYVGSTFSFTYHGGFRPSGIPCLTPEGEPTGLCGCAAHSLPGDRRTMGQKLQSISGIMDFSYGDFQLEPRGDGDVVE